MAPASKKKAAVLSLRAGPNLKWLPKKPPAKKIAALHMIESPLIDDCRRNGISIKGREMTKRFRQTTNNPGPKSEADEIRFYRTNEKPYGAFSNLFKSPIEFEGRLYPTAEHAYQAGKARKPKVREWILAAPSPSLAAMAAHGL